MNIIYRSLRVFALIFALCGFSSGVYGSPRGIRGENKNDDKGLDGAGMYGIGRSLKSKSNSRNSNNAQSRGDSEDIGRLVPVPAPRPVPAPAPRANDVVEVLIRQGGFQTLIKLLFTADLVDTLKNTAQQFTIFAPVNQGLPSGQALADFVVSEPLADLRNVLAYHVVPGIIRSTDLVDGMRLTTLQGTDVVISLTGGTKVNNANILRTDIPAENGIIHAIGNLLMVF